MGPQQRCYLVVNFQAVGNLKVDELRFFFGMATGSGVYKNHLLFIHLDSFRSYPRVAGKVVEAT